MANYTSVPDDDYDVLIEGDQNSNETVLQGDLDNGDIGQCHRYDPQVLSSWLVPQLYTTVSLVGLLDNILVVFILVKYKRLRHVENIYFLNLALSNLCFLLTLPYWARAASHEEIRGHPTCTVFVTLSSVGLHSEALFSALLTLHSYLVFSHVRGLSLAAKRVPCGVIASVLAWLAAILLTVPEFLFHRWQVDSQHPACSLSKPHFLPARGAFWEHVLTLKVNVAALLVPLLVFIDCFVRMRETLRCRERRSDLFKLVFAVMAVFLLMWGPYNVALFLSTFKESFSLHDCRSGYDLDRSIQVTRIIASTHCCVNPLLHVLLDKAFRDRLCCLCGDAPLPPAAGPAPAPPQAGGDHCTAL
ncbi:C-C chemokine receptor-like 2 isoform 1-T3 [Molossus nigricans]